MAGLSTLAQRQSVLESLIRDKLLKPADTTVKGTPAVGYSEPVQKALTIKLRLCDSLSSTYVFRDRAAALTRESYRIQGDTLRKAKDWAAQGKELANRRGWFTGRNRETSTTRKVTTNLSSTNPITDAVSRAC